MADETTTIPPLAATPGGLNGGLMTPKQAAAFLGVSLRAFYYLSGVPRVRLPGRGERPVYRYDPAELRAYWRARLTHTLLTTPDQKAG